MKRRWFIFLGLLIAVALVGLGVFLLRVDTSETLQFEDQQGLSFRYSDDLETKTLSEQDRKDNYLFRAVGKPNKTADLLVVARWEEGFRLVSNVTKKSPIEAIIDNQKLAYPARLEGYKEESVRQYEVSGKKAAEFRFTYTNQEQTIRERLLVFMKNDDIAFHIAVQAKADDFNKLNKQYFQPLFDSVSAQ